MRATSLNVVFFGTPVFALPALEKLLSAHTLKAVVTQPDKPRGRHGTPSPSPVKVWAAAQGITVLAPSALKDNKDFVLDLVELQPDICVVAAYGKMLTAEILAVPRLGFINIHGSLLPDYRGSAPIQRAIMDGAVRTGVTIMHVEEAMDTGDIIETAEIPITPEDDYGSLSVKMAAIGARILVETMVKIADGRAARQSQDDDRATYAPPIEKSETKISWGRSAREIFDQVRALTPRPGAYTFWAGKRLKIIKTAVALTSDATETASVVPGEVIVDGGHLKAGTGVGLLELIEVQPEGRRPLASGDFIRGYHLKNGDMLIEEPAQASE